MLDAFLLICYSVPTIKWAASSMAEQEALNFKVQGSTPWQPTPSLFIHRKVPLSAQTLYLTLLFCLA